MKKLLGILVLTFLLFENSYSAIKIKNWAEGKLGNDIIIKRINDKLVFVDVYVDPSEHVYPMLVAPNGSLKDMWLSKDKKV